MQWLTARSDRERGAVAVIVALLMVPLIGFAALAIDVASMWSQQQRLQVATDASALAIAQDCSRNDCGQPLTTAQTMTDANFGPGATADILTPSLLPSTGYAQVGAKTVSHHLFAPVLGFDSTTVGATSTATWYTPNAGVAVLPLTFSWCDFVAQTGGGLPSQTVSRVINFDKDSTTTCTGPSHLQLPGGFGWVVPNKAGCMVSDTISQQLPSDTGNSLPNGCAESDFVAVQNKIVLLPLFDAVCDPTTGVCDNTANSNANYRYRVYGYVAFKLTGYKFQQSNISWGDNSGCGKNCIKGYFTQFADINDDFPYDPDSPLPPSGLGVEIVTLTS